MIRILLAWLLCFSLLASAQSPAVNPPVSINAPPRLLSTRSVVLYDHDYAAAELEEVQRAFQKIGIDPIAYFETDVVLSGKDPAKAHAEYFTSREITFIILLEKFNPGFQFTAIPFNKMPSLYDASQSAWQVKNNRLGDMLTTIWQDSWRSQKKANFLISEFPETDIAVDPIPGKRQEFYAIDLKVDNLAVPKFGNEGMDKELEDFFLANYPLKYKIVDAGSDEKELRKKGFLYVLCYVHTRGSAAREVLGYDMSKAEENFASVTFRDGQLQLKIIPRDQRVFKFYFRHVDNGNAFFGTKWDADINWLDALRNHVLGFKQEAKIN